MNALASVVWAFLLAHGASAGNAEPPRLDVVTAAVTMGNGEIFSGGDPRLPRLTAVRERLNQTLGALSTEPAPRCNARLCGDASDRTLCHILRSLTPPEQAFCDAALREAIPALLAIDTPAGAPFVLSAVPLRATGASPGEARPVSAITQAAPGSAIVFHDATVAGLPEEELLALVLHELGHKIRWPGTASPLTDETPIGPFARGRDFLDALGAAVALYAAPHSAPVQQPPPAPPSFPARLCAAATDDVTRFLLGLAADVEGTPPDPLSLAGRRKEAAGLFAAVERGAALQTLARRALSSDRARRREIETMFRNYLLTDATADNLALMQTRLAEGDSYDFLVASILGDPQYAAAHGAATGRQFVASAWLDLAGRPPTATEQADGARELEQLDRASWTLRMLRRNATVLGRQVRQWYVHYLNRDPSPSETASAIARLRNDDGWLTAQAAILTGPEYGALQRIRWTGCAGPAPAREPTR